MDKNIELDGKDIFWDGELYSGRVREKVINREIEASKQASVLSFTIPEALSSLPSQAILARLGYHSPTGKPELTQRR